MKIFVISMKSDIKRRENVIQQFGMQSIDFEFVNAVDGRSPEFVIPSIFNQDKFIKYRGRTVETGEVGCYLSHMKAWEKVCQVKEPCIIFEDDFVLSDEFISTIQVIKDNSSKYGFIRIEPWETKCCYKVEESGDYKFYKFLKIPQSTTGYVITPDYAQVFISQSQNEMFLPVDVFIRHSYLHKKPIYGMSPESASVNHELETMIGGRKGKVTTTKIKLLKIKNRCSSAFKTAFTNLVS